MPAFFIFKWLFFHSENEIVHLLAQEEASLFADDYQAALNSPPVAKNFPISRISWNHFPLSKLREALADENHWFGSIRNREQILITLPFHRFTKSILCCACASVLLAACGGGGSSGTADTGSSAAATSSTAADASVNAAAQATPASAPAASTTPAAATTTAASATAAAGPFGQDASQYTMTFDDEFDNGFNSNVWNDKIWYDTSNATKNYTVENGALKIWPQKDGSGNFFNRTLDTDGKYYQTYGYFEIEAKLPNGKGTWPAFWLLNHDQSGTVRPEIDILEAYSGGGAGSGWSDSSLHPTAFASTIWPTGIDNGASAGHYTLQNIGDLSAGFHKYGVKWEPNKITFYFDGQEFYSVNVSMSSRMYILLDLWFGSASGAADDTTPQGAANSYEVNYVRAWQFK